MIKKGAIEVLFKESNRARLEQMFVEANGKSRERVLTYSNVKAALQKIEDTLGIAKKDMIGITAVIDPNAQNFPRAYKYTPHSIYCWAERKSTGWDIKPFGRYPTAREGHTAEITLTETAKAAIIKAKTRC